MNEATFIAHVRDVFEGAIAPGAEAFDNDGATLPPVGAGARRVVTCDAVIDGVHALLGLYPASAGYRAIARNVSDLAAMGARPAGFVWALSWPADVDFAHLDAFLHGARRAAGQFDLPLYGGDIARSPGPFSCVVTAFGDVHGPPLSRGGAADGHRIFLSRPVGEASARLRQARRLGASGAVSLEPEDDAYLWPRPELALGQTLVGRASAAIDVSDGLILDLDRVLKASGVGAHLTDLEAGIAHGFAGDDRTSEQARRDALFGGDDYALLFTLPPDLPAPPGSIALGVCCQSPGIVEAGPRGTSPLSARGFDHLANWDED